MLTWEEVLQIRARRKQGATLKQLAAEFRIDRTQAWNIVTERSWKTPQPFKAWRDRKTRYLIEPGNGCWIWQGSRCQDGYGRIRVNHNGRVRGMAAHRWMYEKHRGPIPPDKEIDHLCHTRACVNPDHLEPVPHRTNVRRGDRTQLTPKDWGMIRLLYAFTDLSQQRIGEMFGVKQAAVSKIVLGVSSYKSI